MNVFVKKVIPAMARIVKRLTNARTAVQIFAIRMRCAQTQQGHTNAGARRDLQETVQTAPISMNAAAIINAVQMQSA